MGKTDMAHNGITKTSKIVAICVGIATILGSLTLLIADVVETRSTARNNRQRIITVEKKVDFIYDQAKENALRKRIEDSLTNFKLMTRIDSIVKVNGDSTPD